MTAKVIPNYPNYTITEDGVVRNVKTGRIKTNLLNLGYYYIHLWKDNVLNSRPVHRLLYQCFVLKDGEEMPEFIDHKDNNRLNNNLSNLRPAIADRDIKLVEYHGEFANNGRHIAL